MLDESDQSFYHKQTRQKFEIFSIENKFIVFKKKN